MSKEIEDRIMAERRPQPMPPTPPNPAVYTIECEFLEEGEATTFSSLHRAIYETGECCTILDPVGDVVRMGV